MNSSAFSLAELTPVVGDFVFVGVTLAFFALAIAYAWFCKKVR
jgi:uncharacterized membrane protein